MSVSAKEVAARMVNAIALIINVALSVIARSDSHFDVELV